MKTLIITGGSSGIGKACASLFAEKGYKVYELSRHGESSKDIKHIDCDVTQPDDCRRAVKQAFEESGHIDLVVNNAGMGISGAIEFTKTEDIKRQMDVNFFGSINVTQAVLPYMRKARNGRIIFVSSLAGIFALPFQAFYSASKSAVVSFAMALRNEVRPFGISVSCMMPGDVKTGFTASRMKNTEGDNIYLSMNRSVSSMEHDESTGIAPSLIAKKICSIAQYKSPKATYTVGLIYHLFMLLAKILPLTIANRIVGMIYAK